MTHTERTSVLTRREFIVPVDPAYGAHPTAVNDALRTADRAYREDQHLAAGTPLPENAIAFWPGAAEIVVSYETEAPPAVSAEAAARIIATHDHLAGRVSTPYDHLPPAVKEEYAATARTILDFLRPPATPARP
ncbi:hypothetical protein ACFUEN_29170 [Streptomyces griseorubiginosus]|uniref:hypothetical protein n=1 Tax=Streptomyces griseorubiginosus TaxID=67304 RepID=UPI003642CC0A